MSPSPAYPAFWVLLLGCAFAAVHAASSLAIQPNQIYVRVQAPWISPHVWGNNQPLSLWHPLTAPTGTKHQRKRYLHIGTEFHGSTLGWTFMTVRRRYAWWSGRRWSRLGDRLDLERQWLDPLDGHLYTQSIAKLRFWRSHHHRTRHRHPKAPIYRAWQDFREAWAQGTMRDRDRIQRNHNQSSVQRSFRLRHEAMRELLHALGTPSEPWNPKHWEVFVAYIAFPRGSIPGNPHPEHLEVAPVMQRFQLHLFTAHHSFWWPRKVTHVITNEFRWSIGEGSTGSELSFRKEEIPHNQYTEESSFSEAVASRKPPEHVKLGPIITDEPESSFPVPSPSETHDPASAVKDPEMQEISSGAVPLMETAVDNTENSDGLFPDESPLIAVPEAYESGEEMPRLMTPQHGDLVTFADSEGSPSSPQSPSNQKEVQHESEQASPLEAPVSPTNHPTPSPPAPPTFPPPRNPPPIKTLPIDHSQRKRLARGLQRLIDSPFHDAGILQTFLGLMRVQKVDFWDCTNVLLYALLRSKVHLARQLFIRSMLLGSDWKEPRVRQRENAALLSTAEMEETLRVVYQPDRTEDLDQVRVNAQFWTYLVQTLLALEVTNFGSLGFPVEVVKNMEQMAADPNILVPSLNTALAMATLRGPSVDVCGALDRVGAIVLQGIQLPMQGSSQDPYWSTACASAIRQQLWILVEHGCFPTAQHTARVLQQNRDLVPIIHSAVREFSLEYWKRWMATEVDDDDDDTTQLSARPLFGYMELEVALDTMLQTLLATLPELSNTRRDKLLSRCMQVLHSLEEAPVAIWNAWSSTFLRPHLSQQDRIWLWTLVVSLPGADEYVRELFVQLLPDARMEAVVSFLYSNVPSLNSQLLQQQWKSLVSTGDPAQPGWESRLDALLEHFPNLQFHLWTEMKKALDAGQIQKVAHLGFRFANSPEERKIYREMVEERLRMLCERDGFVGGEKESGNGNGRGGWSQEVRDLSVLCMNIDELKAKHTLVTQGKLAQVQRSAGGLGKGHIFV